MSEGRRGENRTPPAVLGVPPGPLCPSKPPGHRPPLATSCSEPQTEAGLGKAGCLQGAASGRLGACRCLDPDLRLRGPRGGPGRGWSPQHPLCSRSPGLANKRRASHTLPSTGVSSRQLCPWALPTVRRQGCPRIPPLRLLLEPLGGVGRAGGKEAPRVRLRLWEYRAESGWPEGLETLSP